MQTETYLAVLAQPTETRRDYGYIVMEQRLHRDGGDLPNMGVETPQPRSSIRATSTLNCGAISPTFTIILFTVWRKCNMPLSCSGICLFKL